MFFHGFFYSKLIDYYRRLIILSVLLLVAGGVSYGLERGFTSDNNKRAVPDEQKAAAIQDNDLISKISSSQFEWIPFVREGLTRAELASLKALAGIMHLFKKSSNEIWPGYDLSKKEFLFYLPEKWVLFLNHKSPVEDFKPYPTNAS